MDMRAHLRDLMVCKNPETVQLMEVGAGSGRNTSPNPAEVSLPFLYEGLEICNQADIQFRGSRNQRLTIELALVKLANLSEVSKKKIVTVAEPGPSPEPAAPAVPEPEPKAGIRRRQWKLWQPRMIPPPDNGLSRLIKTPGISIKESLKGAEPEPMISEVIPSEEASAQEHRPAESPKILADPDSIIRAWNEYATSIQKSKPRIYSTLIHHKPVVKGDGVVMVLLNSEAQRDNFTKNIKSALLKYIKKNTGFTSLELITEVSESEENGKKIYTEQDKMEFLLKKNPELGKLKSRFNLDFDD